MSNYIFTGFTDHKQKQKQKGMFIFFLINWTLVTVWWKMFTIDIVILIFFGQMYSAMFCNTLSMFEPGHFFV